MSETNLLLVEQIKHAIDLLRADLNSLELRLEHADQLSRQRLQALEKCSADVEGRLREVSDTVTQLKVLTSLTGSGSSLLSLAALLKAFLGF